MIWSMLPAGIAVALMSWGCVLEFGASPAIAAAAAAVDHDFGVEWPYVMMLVGAFMMAGTIRKKQCRWIYRRSLVLSTMVWAAMAAVTIDHGWYWAFSTVLPPLLSAASFMLKVAEIRSDRWQESMT